MPLDDSAVYEKLNPFINKNNTKGFSEELLKIVNEGFDDKDAAGMLAHMCAEIIVKLNNNKKFEEAFSIVKSYLESSDKIPATTKKKQYFASFAISTIKNHPELADDFEKKLLREEYIDKYYAINIAAGFFKMNRIDKMMVHAVKAMEAGASLSDILSNSVIESYYKSNSDFKSLLENKAAKKAEEEIYFTKNPDPDNFSEVLAAAKAEMKRDYYDSRAKRILDLVKFSTNVEEIKQVENFLRTGFQILKDHAKMKESLINSVLYDALARAIGKWSNPKFSDLLMKEFIYVIENDKEITDGVSRHYELNITAGTIALAISNLDYIGEIAPFDKFLKSFEWRYKGDDFVMKVKYAKWMITKGAADAVSFLADKSITKGISYAACALTDLDFKEAAPVLKTILTSIKNPVTAEVIKESLTRLTRQSKPPIAEERMINLFGAMTPSEIALEGFDDNEFAIRARNAADDPNIGATYEADNSAAEDR